MSLISFLKSTSIELFRYFLKGARVDAALTKLVKSRLNRGSQPKPGAVQKTDGHVTYWDQDDINYGWQVITTGNIILKNNSSQSAYDINIVNASDCFTTYKKPEKLLSLGPRESIEISFTFEQWLIAHTGTEADAQLSLIPKDKERFPLKISYKNEGGHIFYTVFRFSATNPENVYWI